MKDQFELNSFSLENSFISTRHNKKYATTRIVSAAEPSHTQERNRSNSHCQFSTKLTYAPFIHAKKAEILPSPITLRPSQSDNEPQLNILDEVSMLTEIEDETDCEFVGEAPHENIKLMRMYLKSSFDSLNCGVSVTLFKEAEMILNSDKTFSKLICNSNISASKNVNHINSNRLSIWKNAIKQTFMTCNSSTMLSVNESLRKSNNNKNTLNILNILETSVNEFLASDVSMSLQRQMNFEKEMLVSFY